jgi:ATP-dependent Clp protease, protease subunit
VILAPQVRLLGKIQEGVISSLHEQLDSLAQGTGPIAIELMTSGGEADVGRRLALEVPLGQATAKRRLLFVGKTSVYSAA